MDVLWIESAGTWLKSSQLLGSDLVSTRLLVAAVLVVSSMEVSMCDSVCWAPSWGGS